MELIDSINCVSYDNDTLKYNISYTLYKCNDKYRIQIEQDAKGSTVYDYYFDSIESITRLLDDDHWRMVIYFNTKHRTIEYKFKEFNEYDSNKLYDFLIDNIL